jgi:hypothetical protein
MQAVEVAVDILYMVQQLVQVVQVAVDQVLLLIMVKELQVPMV